MNQLFHRVRFLIIPIFIAFSCKHNHHVTSLVNGQISIDLSINDKNVPYISNVRASDNSVIYFTDKSSGMVLQNRLNNNFLRNKPLLKPLSDWQITEDSIFIKAQASVKVDACEFTMHVDLMKDTPLFNVYNSVSGNVVIEIKEFPVLGTELSLPDSTQSIRWWKSIEYTPQEEQITSDTHLSLNSRGHSADNTNNIEGNVPYWTIETPGSFMGFSIAWCGGWRASLNGGPGILISDVYLQEDETQLTLNPGEVVNGPEISIFCSPVSDPVLSRKDWLNSRALLASKLYPTPHIGIPFIYNHWYSVRSALSEQFIKDQVKWFDEYDFDVFMIDDGWFQNEGSWTPSSLKFKAQEFEKALAAIRSGGAMAGLWSCPQFIEAKEPLPDFIDQPGLYNSERKAWLIDYNAMDFSDFMVKHLDTLNRIGANWWKYDQTFFAKRPRSGKLKSVNAFQDGFVAARKKYPDIIFEACMGGGKMINEFTDRISQIHWIRDGNRTGYVHAMTNIHEALGAVDFLEPQKVQRWTNRINETEMKTTDLIKLYCRSCMIGSWGISADLNKISAAQRAVIVSEVKNYRQLNEIKKDMLIEYNYPKEYVSLVPVTYYNESYTKAAVLLYSLNPNERPVKYKLKTRLTPGKSYKFYDVDRKSNAIVSGNIFDLTLNPGQNSAIFFIYEVASN
jgi:hypothetical protein